MMEKRELQLKDLSEIRECIQKTNNFFITTHIHPDGDSIASVLLFASLLKHLGKRYVILLDDDVPYKFDFLPGVEEIKHYRKFPNNFIPQVLVVLDSSDIERIGSVGRVISDEIVVLNVDHHPSNRAFGDVNAIDSEESSTAEIVHALLTLCQVPVSPEIATLVYTGIVCDTGRFLFPNTNLRSLRVCTQMIGYGALPSWIAQKLYCRSSKTTIRALASALSTLEFHFNGTVSCIHLSNGILASNNEVDTEGFVDYLLAVEDTEVEFFMCEKEPNVFRVSFRSKELVDVNAVAQTLGGGGHARASGCTMEGTVDEVKNKILHVLKDYVR